MTKEYIPKHVAFIMDGNRRWARKKGLTTLKGHQAGYDRLSDIGRACLKRGIKYMTVYAFSTENWNRSKSEVTYLMRLLKRALTKEINKFDKEGLLIRVIGEQKGLSQDLRAAIKQAAEITKHNTKGVFTIALNYGGRHEIIHAIKKLLADKRKPQEINQKLISRYLYTAGIPDPDLIIRTSGELRLSNFLLWQLAYSELYFTPTYWPDFDEKELDKALKTYRERQRRYGK